MNLKIVIGLLILMANELIVFSQVEEVIIKKEVLNKKDTTGIIYVTVDEMPTFPDGEEGLLKFYQIHSKYKISKEGNQKVYYQIVVNQDGSISNFKILKGQTGKLNNDVERIIKVMPLWLPGKKNGRPVKVLKTLSINYQIE
jgi:protein TonB